MAKGLKTFSSEEGSNISAGQCAAYYFYPNGNLEADRTLTAGSGELVNVDFIVGFKSGFQNGTVEVQARSLIGDDLAMTGVYDPSSSRDITLIEGDVVWGCFDKIYVEDPVLVYFKMKSSKA